MQSYWCGLFLAFSRTLNLTLHDVIVPAVGELPVISVLVKPSEKDLVRVTVFEVYQFAKAC